MRPPLAHEQTLFVPKPRGASVVARARTGLPADRLNLAATRLQILAWLYALIFAMAAFFPPLLFSAERKMLFAHSLHWAPGVVSIAVAVSDPVSVLANGTAIAAVETLATPGTPGEVTIDGGRHVGAGQVRDACAPGSGRRAAEPPGRDRIGTRHGQYQRVARPTDRRHRGWQTVDQGVRH